MNLTFQPCRPADVALLDRVNPSPSVDSFHVGRFDRQRSGDSAFLLAWQDRVPVGHAEIRWTGCRDEAVRTAYPRCPEINGLEVFPDRLRGNGIGTALIEACEELARDNGYRQIGLGVAQANPRAARLYRRLGYAGFMSYLDRYSCVDSTGTRHDFADPCVFLTRPLRRTPVS